MEKIISMLQLIARAIDRNKYFWKEVKKMSHENKNLFQKVAGLSGHLVRGIEDRVVLSYKLLSEGPVRPYRDDLLEKAYLVEERDPFSVIWIALFGYRSGFWHYADYDTKGITPPTLRQNPDPKGFEWDEKIGGYKQVVWCGCLKPDREK